MLPNGAMIIDTPGMRELGMWNTEKGISETFKDIEELTKMCKFSDCTHKNEPGCKILEAIENGELSEDRFEKYLSLKKESEYNTNSEQYLKNKHDKFKEISKINNIEMYILSLSKTKKITEKKKIWLKKYVPFIKEENWIILTKEIGEYSNENRNEIKGKNIELRQKDYDKSIMLDDEQVVLREAKKILNDKIEVFHISSALI